MLHDVVSQTRTPLEHTFSSALVVRPRLAKGVGRYCSICCHEPLVVGKLDPGPHALAPVDAE